MASRQLTIPEPIARLAHLPVVRWFPAILTVLIATFLRFWRLGEVKNLQFDERYYVPQAYALMRRGYESDYGKTLEAIKGGSTFKAAYVEQVMDTLGFNSHPPLGKWLITPGMYLFGTDSPFAWRFTAALFGILLVVLTIVLAYQLFESVAWATFAGFLVAVDGVAISMSRTAMLDIFLATLVLAGVCAVVADRHRERRRITGLLDQPAPETDEGTGSPALRIPAGLATFRRPWLILAAVMFGAATAVKFSGVVFFAVFCVYVIVSDWTLRGTLPRLARVTSTAVQAVKAAAVAIPAAVATWTASWTGLFLSGLLTKPFGWFLMYANAWSNDSKITAHNSAASPAWSWFIPLRPVIFYTATDGEDPDTKMIGWVNEMMTLGNPAIWWTGAVALLAVIVLAVWKRQHAPIVITLGVVAGWGPWLLIGARTIYQYYTIAFVAFVALAVAYCGQRIAAAARRSDYLTKLRKGAVLAFLMIVSLLTVYFLPMNIGGQMSLTQWDERRWLQDWFYVAKKTDTSATQTRSLSDDPLVTRAATDE